MDRKKKILTGFLIFIGFCIMLYPAVSNIYNQHRFVVETENYEDSVTDLSEEELEKEWEKVKIYNDNLRGDPVHDPFVPGSGSALPENYMECLNVNDVMGMITVPSIGIKLPIYHGTSEQVLKQGIGHIEGTALPEGREGCHPILTGHTGLPEAKLFTDLINVKEGDYFYLSILEKELWYQVDQISVILPEDLKQLQAYEEHDYVTLLTCTPYGINSHRLLVRGERCEKPEEEPKMQKPVDKRSVFEWIIVGLIIFVVLAALLLMRKRRKGQ